MWRNQNPCALLVGMLSGSATVENILAVPQKLKHRITIWSSKSTTGYMPQRCESRNLNTYLHTNVHSSTIHNIQKVRTVQMPIKRLIDRQSVVYTYDGILFSFNKNDILLCVTVQLNLENIVLSEISQTPKGKCCTIPLSWGIWSWRILIDKKYVRGKAWRWGIGS